MNLKKIMLLLFIIILTTSKLSYADSEYNLIIKGKDINNKDLKGSVYEIRNINTEEIIEISLIDKSVDFIYLPDGEYEIIEIKAPEGYDLNPKKISIKIPMEDNGEIIDKIEIIPKHEHIKKENNKYIDSHKIIDNEKKVEKNNNQKDLANITRQKHKIPFTGILKPSISIAPAIFFLISSIFLKTKRKIK